MVPAVAVSENVATGLDVVPLPLPLPDDDGGTRRGNGGAGGGKSPDANDDEDDATGWATLSGDALAGAVPAGGEFMARLKLRKRTAMAMCATVTATTRRCVLFGPLPKDPIRFF
jgi:hypothetical protein